METSFDKEPAESQDQVTSRPKEITIDTVKIRNLEDAERLVSGIQMAAKRAFGHRDMAMGVPSMDLEDFLKSFPLGAGRVVVSMPGTVEIYGSESGNWNELTGFVEVRDGGKYVPL